MRTLVFSFLCCFILSIASCDSAAKTMAAKTEMTESAAVPSYAGVWLVTVENTPLGTVTGELKLEDISGSLKGVFVTPDGKSLPLQSVSTTEDGLTTGFYYPDYDVDVDVQLTGKPTAEMLIGQSLGEYRTTAKRKE